MQNSDTIKYIIHAKIKAQGVIERPDVIGAIFGQTEGLIGNDLDLRELQKSGRIGRLEVNIKSNMGKSVGTIEIPSSLDKVETAVLAASLETIDRIGPCLSTITVTRIEDVRSSKRKQIIERAKRIINEMFDENIPESQEITDEVRQSLRIEELTTYGKENLPMGPNVLDSDAILIVEGRADVLNLLKYGIKNAIAVGGTNIPQAIIDLCKKKTCTAFTDGDRGGELIIKELLQVADIDYIARAPDGKGVEELVHKEIVKALRQKIPVEQALDYYHVSKKRKLAIAEAARKKLAKKSGAEEIETEEISKKKEEDKEVTFKKHMEELSGTLTARLLDDNNNVMREVPVRDLASALKESNSSVTGVIFDGVITQRIVDIASERGIGTLIGAKIGNVVKAPSSIHIEASGV